MIPKALRPYSKAVVAAVAFTVLIVVNRLGIDIPPLEVFLLDLGRELLLGALGTWGVYQVTNEPKQ